jgi:hypothetical protein
MDVSDVAVFLVYFVNLVLSNPGGADQAHLDAGKRLKRRDWCRSAPHVLELR